MAQHKWLDRSTNDTPRRGVSDTSLSLFSSPRERRLWIWTLLLVVAIYATLGISGTVAGVLRTHGLFEFAFALCMLLVVLVIVLFAIPKRPNLTQVGIVIGIITVYALVFVRMAIPEERTHLIEYGVLAIFISEALFERKQQGRHVLVPSLLAMVMTASIGTFDECIQLFLARRVFDWHDILFNVLAAAMAVSARSALAWASGKMRR